MEDSTTTWDLHEWRWDRQKATFVKTRSWLLNTSKNMCYGAKKTLVQQVSRFNVFTVTPNGSLLYTNEFPAHLKAREEKRMKELEEQLLEEQRKFEILKEQHQAKRKC
jgi:hypothetical protein